MNKKNLGKLVFVLMLLAIFVAPVLAGSGPGPLPEPPGGDGKPHESKKLNGGRVTQPGWSVSELALTLKNFHSPSGLALAAHKVACSLQHMAMKSMFGTSGARAGQMISGSTGQQIRTQYTR